MARIFFFSSLSLTTWLVDLFSSFYFFPQLYSLSFMKVVFFSRRPACDPFSTLPP